MMVCFAERVEEATGKVYDYKMRRVRCIAHIVNLATQALIAAHTKSKHYNPERPDEDLTIGFDRDEVGLVRSITVKVCKPLFLLFLNCR
jgi:hypothetical protein